VFLHVCHWLQVNGFWVAVIAWAVFSGLTVIAGWRPWRRHRKLQEQIADSLDTSTPGGLTDLVEAVRELGRQGDDAREADH
jgi:membrane protein implicated in regulation of membrane protease activity